MRVPRIAGVDLLWAVALLGCAPAAVFLELSGYRTELDAYGFDFLIDVFFAALFFGHGVFANALLHTAGSNSAVNRFFITQGVVYILIGIAMEFFWAANFMMVLGAYYLCSRLIVYLDNQILRFMVIVLILTAILVFAFNPERAVESGVGRVEALMNHLTNHHFNIVYWLPIFISGILFGRTGFQSSKRTGELRLMAVAFIGFGVILHVLGRGLFHTDPATPSVWGVGFELALPAFYALSIGLAQLLVLLLEGWYKKSVSKSLFNRVLGMGRLHLFAYVAIALTTFLYRWIAGAPANPRALSLAIAGALIAVLLVAPVFRKVSDPLLYFSRVKKGKEQTEDL